MAHGGGQKTLMMLIINRKYCRFRNIIPLIVLLSLPFLSAVPTTEFILTKNSPTQEKLGIPKFFDVANGVDLLIEINDQNESSDHEVDDNEDGSITLTVTHPLLFNGAVSWTFNVAKTVDINLNKTICFKKSEATDYDNDASDGTDVGEKTEIITPNIIEVSAESTLVTDRHVRLRLVNRTNKCPEGNEPNVFIGVAILLMGLVLIGSVLGVLIKNQLGVCADTGNSFSSVVCGN